MLGWSLFGEIIQIFPASSKSLIRDLKRTQIEYGAIWGRLSPGEIDFKISKISKNTKKSKNYFNMLNFSDFSRQLKIVD